MKPYEKKGNEEIESENHSLKQTKSANSQLETDTHTLTHSSEEGIFLLVGERLGTIGSRRPTRKLETRIKPNP